MDILKYCLNTLLLACVFTGIGFLWGKSKRSDPVVTYVERPRIGGKTDLWSLLPKTSIEPGEKEIQYVFMPLRDSVRNRGVLGRENEGIDTLQAMKATVLDWNTRRDYSHTLFDDPEIGKMDLTFSIQYNKLGDLEWGFTPVQKIVNPAPSPRLSPFVRASVTTLGVVGLGGGVRSGAWGFDLSIIRDTHRGQNGVELGIAYSF